jgi:hypothetical protein
MLKVKKKTNKICPAHYSSPKHVCMNHKVQEKRQVLPREHVQDLQSMDTTPSKGAAVD